MKNKFLFVVLISLLFAAGIVLISCGSKCTRLDGDCEVIGTDTSYGNIPNNPLTPKYKAACNKIDCAIFDGDYHNQKIAKIGTKCDC